MIERSGYIGLFRCLIEKPIWENSTPEQKVILITLLLMANHKEKEWEWQGKKFRVQPGQFVTSLDSIKKLAGKGISIKNIRTALERFEKLEFLANESTKTGRLITILNWHLYQVENMRGGKDDGKEVAKRWQRGGKEVATNKNDNNDLKMIKNDEYIYGAVVDYLNEVVGSKYQATSQKTKSLIDARLKDGFCLDDFKKVIDNKASEWTGTEWEKFLRPETLFGTKFESYLNQKTNNKEDWRIS